MPIKGQTDTDIGLPPLIGRLNKGGPKENGQFGKNLEGRFRFTPVPESDTALLARFHEKYGEPKTKIVKGKTESYYDWPRELNILLLHETPEEAFPHGYYEWYQGHYEHICDGDMISMQYDPRIRRMRHTAEPCPFHSGTRARTKERPGCKPLGTLSFLLPHLNRRGYVKMETHSWHDCVNIGKTLIDTYRYLTTEVLPAAAVLGVPFDFRLSTTPFILTRRLIPISRPVGDKTIQSPEWLCHLEIHPEFYRRTQEMLARAEQQTRNLLPKPKEDPPHLIALENSIDYTDAEIIEHVQTA